MGHDAKIHINPKHGEKQDTLIPSHSRKVEAPNLANLTETELQHMSSADMVHLNRIIGNRAVARLMAQRQDEDELEYPGPRSRREWEDIQDYQRTQITPLRGESAQQRGSSELRSSTTHRAAPSSSATGNVGDAVDLDGQAMYGWDRTITAADVARVVQGVTPTASSEEQMPRIVIFSGTHGNETGHLINDAVSRGFVAEDQATANAANAADPQVQTEVIDVVNSYPTKADLTANYGRTNYIRILAWCFSKRSYGLRSKVKSNWWAEPDNL